MSTKRILSLVLALVMVLGTFGTVFAAGTGNEKVDKLIELDLVKGDEKGDYRLSDTIRRDEVAAMVVRAMDLESVANAMINVPTKFVDVKAGQWNNGYVSVAEGRGITKGTGPSTFNPERPITYQEVAAMLVRVIGLDAKEEATFSWPASYVAKAHEMGILKDVEIANMGELAIREKVFEMVFNTVTNKDANLLVANTVEGIVVENYRTENLKKDDIIVHVMKDQDEKSGGKYDAGKEFKVTLDAKLKAKGLDVETLLGKVVTVSFDKDEKVIDIKLVEGYNYEQGKINEVTGKDIRVGGKWYTVGKEEARTDFDERLYQVYLNNEDVNYNRFAYVADWDKNEATKDTWGTRAEYARITVKNGKVLFIDSYEFDDIAPVAKDITDKDVVAYYADDKDGEIRNLSVGSSAYVINFEEGEINLGNNKDIAMNDVIHHYTDYKKNLTVFVRPFEDNKVEGVYRDASAASSKDEADILIRVDNEDYLADITTKNRNPVYSIYSSEFDFLTLSNQYDLDLRNFARKEVLVLRDMFDKVQLIGSETIDGRFYALISDTYNYDFRLLRTDNTKEWFDTDRETVLAGVTGNTREQRLANFHKGDLVLATAEEGLISRLENVTGTPEAISEVSVDVVNLASGYKYLGRNAVVFVVGEEVALSVSAFRTNYIIDDLANHPIEGYVVLSARDNSVADVLVITKATAKDNTKFDNLWAAKVERVRFTDVKGEGTVYYLDLINSSRERSTHMVETGTLAHNLVRDKVITAGDIIRVKNIKNDDETKRHIVELTELIDIDNYTSYEVTNLGIDRVRNEKFVELKGLGTIWVSRNADVFGDYSIGSYVAISAPNAYDVVDLIYVVPKLTSGITQPPTTTGVVTYIDAATGVIAIDAKTYPINDLTMLVNAKGSLIAVGKANIETALTAGLNKDVISKVEVDANGIVTRLTASAVKSETDAAQAVIDDLNADELNPEHANFDNAGEVAAARAAYNALPQSQKDLVTNYAKLVAAELALEVDAFETTHAAILAETVATVDETDKAAIDGALADYADLSSAAKAKLTAEKTLLDQMKAKVDPLADAANVAADKLALDAAAIKDTNADLNNVVADLDLITTGTNGSTISWSSNNTALVAADGTVTQPNGADVQVTLTATITKGATTDTKVFVVTVKGL